MKGGRLGYRFDPEQIHSPELEVETSHGHAYFTRLRNRLRWQLLVAYVTPLLVLYAYFQWQYTVALRERTDNHLKSVAENQRNTVDLFLQERLANLRNLFNSPSFRVPPEEGDMPRALAKLKGENPTFVDVGLFDSSGVLTSYAGAYPELQGKVYSGERWWKTLVTDGAEHYISDVYLGFRHRPHFIVAIRRQIDARTWVLRASVDPVQFGEFVQRSHLQARAEAFIVNSRGERQTIDGKEEPATTPEFVPPLSREAQVVETTVGGRKYLYSWAWLATHEWALVVRVPKSDAYGVAWKSRLAVIGIMFLTLAGLVVLVFKNTRRLVQKLEASDTAKQDLRSQLFHAAKLASVGEMAAGVAHEINNPLAIIYEEAGMMRDMLDPQFGCKLEEDDLRERLDAIRDACMRGRGITGKLLAFSRQYDSIPEPTDIHGILSRIERVKEQEFKVSDIEVVKDYAHDLPPVQVSPNQLEQVFLNMLNNASDAIKGPGTITLRTALEGGQVRVDVQDSGCGMSPEHMAQIFFPFFTTKGVGKGTGLGLSISYGIVKSMGGRIVVESEPGKGTSFSIYLPVASPGAAAQGEKKA